ncbi:MAG: 30S ribosomal protein S4 [Candidatus Aenigmarchaeota archaeon]|nr:30S ribosomal protein S4 [Candidatus Aenigmarchaeota archaeon]
MGDPKKLRRKWKRPRKTFNTARIAADKELKKNYGFRRKKEIWKLDYAFKHLMRRARKILATKDKEAEEILMNKLIKMGLIEKKVHIDEILSMSFEDLCERRLQTILFKKGLATTLKQARQFIAHKKVRVGEKMVNQPNYLVLKDEEDKIKLKEKIKKPKVVEKVPEGENTDTGSEKGAKINEAPATEKPVEEFKEAKTEEVKEEPKETKTKEDKPKEMKEEPKETETKEDKPKETETKEDKPVEEVKEETKKKEDVKEDKPVEEMKDTKPEESVEEKK